MEKRIVVPFYEAVKAGDFNEVLRKLVQDPQSILETDENGRTGLLWSITMNYQDITSICIENGISVINVQDSGGVSPLILASKEGQIETVRQLLEQENISLNLQMSDGQTALISSIENSHKEITKLLIQKGAAKFLKKNNGDTALITACTLGNFEAVSALTENSWVDLDVQGHQGDTALIRACTNGEFRIVSLLLKKGAAVDIKNYNLETAFDVAKSDEVRALLRESFRQNETVSVPLPYPFAASPNHSSSHPNNPLAEGDSRNYAKALATALRELEDSKAEILRLQSDLLCVTTPLAQLETYKIRFDESNMLINNAKLETEVVKQHLIQKEQETHHLNIENNQLKLEILKLKNDYNILSTNKNYELHEEFEKHIQRLKEENVKLQSELSFYVNKSNELNLKYESSLKEIELLREDLVNTVSKKKETDRNFDKLQVDNIKIQSELHSSIIQCSSLRNQISQLEEEVEKMKKFQEEARRLEGLTSTVTIQATAIVETQAELESVRLELNKNKTELQEARRKLTLLEENVVEVEREYQMKLNDLTEALVQMKEQMSQKEIVIQLEKEQCIIDREIQIKDYMTRNSLMKEENYSLSTQLKETINLLNEIKNQLTTSRNEALTYSAHIKNLEEQLNLKRDELSHLKEELESLSSALSRKTQDFEISKAELNCLKARFPASFVSKMEHDDALEEF